MSQALDAKWFDELQALTLAIDELAWYKAHTRISKAEQERFLDDDIENPRYSLYESGAMDFEQEHLVRLRQTILDEELNVTVRSLYVKKIDSLLLRSQMLQATAKRDDELFKQMNTALYGTPKKKYFAYVAKRVKEMTNPKIERHPRGEAAAKRLRTLFSKIDTARVGVDRTVLPPKVDVGSMLATEAEICDIFNSVLDRCKIPGWQLQIDTTERAKVFSVDSTAKIIHIPSHRRLALRHNLFTTQRAQAVAEHEIGVHVRRAYNGGRQSLRLLSVGLDNYLPGEEGVAGYVQQQTEGATEFLGFQLYLAITLALGMDGTPRDFRSVFLIMKDYYLVRIPESCDRPQIAAHAAWNICARVFRGTTGRSRGIVNARDIAYLEGNIGIWDVLVENPDRFTSLFIGKYNPLLKRHVDALQTLEILKDW